MKSSKILPQINKISPVSCFLLIMVLSVGLLQAQLTENVFIVVIDGARYSETFGDPTHKYIPRLWNELRPLGTIYTSFYIEGLTQTNPGHTSIVTGTWQYIANNGAERAHKPTVFEYYRKQKNAPQDKCFVILGKDKLDVLTHSDHNDYGIPYQASVSYSGSQYDDGAAFANFRGIIADHHPRLAIINFPQTDNSAHTGLWSSYFNSIRVADSLVYELWQVLQSDSVYRGKTTLIITGDHGRHLDSVENGFQSHGDSCEGCRHICTMIIGPDTPAGAVDSAKRLQIDIAPTVGKILNFTPEYSTGTVISSALITKVKSESYYSPQRNELLQNYPNPFNPSTRMSFVISQLSLVTLGVYDVLGREIEILVNELKHPGEYGVRWDASDLAGGVYLCRLSTRDNGIINVGSVVLNKMIFGK